MTSYGAPELPDHMNGRIYDPLLGRFLSADVVVQFPGNLQSYNRYSYVQNNPLTFRDPSGHVIETAWDVANIGIGVASLWSNIKGGNVGAAILDGVGIVADTAATAVPFIPGGAGTAIKVARTTAKVAGNIEKAGNAVVAGDKVVTDVKEGNVGLDTLGAAAQVGAAAKAKSGANKADGGSTPALAKVDGGDVKSAGGDKVSTLPANQKAGKEWEQKVEASPPPGHSTASQVTLVVETPNGPVRVRADQVVKNEQTGKYTLVEAKGSATAPLTENQSQALPVLGAGGTATVAGDKAKDIGLPAGATVEFENVIVVRPNGTELIRK